MKKSSPEILILLSIILRIAWQVWPNIYFCFIFWALFITAKVLILNKSESIRKLPHIVHILGCLSNAVVTIANNGFMPCAPDTEDHGIWVSSKTATNLTFLGDIYYGFSIGDILIFSGLLLAIIIAIILKLKPQKQSIEEYNV